MKRVGSIWAMICPSLTWLLKSAPSFWMMPETCEPTCTVTTALQLAGGGDHLLDGAAIDLATLKVTGASLRRAAQGEVADARADDDQRRRRP